MEKRIDIDDVTREATKLLGSDIHPVPLEDRINMTPINGVEWSGARGQSFCTPTSPEIQSLLAKYGQTGIRYSLNGEPDLSKVAVTSVKISDMTEDMGHDYTSTIHKLLKTDFAKENGITSPTQMRSYLKDKNLTIHEGNDGVTEYLVDRRIHQTFRHYGGRAKLRGFENADTDRLIQSKLSEGGVNVNKALVKGSETIENVSDNASRTVNEAIDAIGQSDLASIHHNSMQAAESAMILTTITTIVDNAFQTARGEKSKEEAIEDSAKTVLETGATRYTQKTISQVTEKVINKTIDQGFSQTTNIAGNNVAEATVKIGQQFVRYCKDEISDEELLENTGDILMEQLMIFAAECVLQGIPGGALVGRYVATVLYQSMKTVKLNEKQFGQYIDFVKELSYETTKEIEKYRAEFRLYTEEYNSYTMDQINKAFDLLDAGMFGNDVEKSSQAIEMLANTIGETVSDITEEMLFDTFWKGE